MMEEFAQILGNGFFPVAMCGAMLWLNYQLMDQHRQESKLMADAISKLEVAVTELTTYIKTKE